MLLLGSYYRGIFKFSSAGGAQAEDKALIYYNILMLCLLIDEWLLLWSYQTLILTLVTMWAFIKHKYDYSNECCKYLKYFP